MQCSLLRHMALSLTSLCDNNSITVMEEVDRRDSPVALLRHRRRRRRVGAGLDGVTGHGCDGAGAVRVSDVPREAEVALQMDGDGRAARHETHDDSTLLANWTIPHTAPTCTCCGVASDCSIVKETGPQLTHLKLMNT